MLRHKVDIAAFRKVLLVHNHNAGKQNIFRGLHNNVQDIINRLTSKFGSAKFKAVEVSTFRETQDVARKMVADQVDWVIVAGGDGTLRALVEECVRLDYWPYISIYPAGTVNLVAKELMQKTDVHNWMYRVSKGITTPVCLGKATDRIFLTVAGLGVDSLVVSQVTPKQKKYLSTLAYVRQGGMMVANNMLRHNWKYSFEVMVDRDGTWHKASSVIVTKSRYYAGRFSLVNGGSLSNPTLYACLFTKERCVDFLRYTALIAADMLSLDKSVEIYPATHVDIRCNVKKFAAELDGDAVVTSPLSLDILPRPLHFIS